MKRILNFLLGRQRVLVVDVARFGPRLKWADVQSALSGRQQELMFRAFGQVLSCQRELNQTAVEDKSNLPNGQTAYEAGAAACAADMMALLLALESGQCRDGKLREYFGADLKAD